MRTFGLVGLLVVLVIVGWLSTRQVVMVPASALPASAPRGNVAEQSRQIQQQIKQQVESTLQAPRDLPDDAK